MSDSYSLAAANTEAQTGRYRKQWPQPRRKTLQEALDEAARPGTPQQRRLQEKYKSKWAANGNGEGCVFK